MMTPKCEPLVFFYPIGEIFPSVRIGKIKVPDKPGIALVLLKEVKRVAEETFFDEIVIAAYQVYISPSCHRHGLEDNVRHAY